MTWIHGSQLKNSDMLLQNISNTSFTKSLTHEYRLCLILGINGISYMIVDGGDKVVTFKRFSIKPDNKITDMKTIFSSDEKLLHNYKSTKIGIDAHAFTLVPDRLFDADDKELYLEKTSRINQKEWINNDYILFNHSQLVYAWESELIAVLKNYFPSSQMFHNVTSLMNGWRKQAEVKEGKKIYIHVFKDHFTIAFFDERDLIFVNRFSFQTSGDFLYYTLMTYDRFDLKPESIPTILSGLVVEESEIYKKLFSYIRHLQFMPIIPYYEFSEEFQQLPHHHYFDLYSLKLCES